MLTTATLWYLAPEVILVISSVVLYLWGAFKGQKDFPAVPEDGASRDDRSVHIALVGVVLAGWGLVRVGLPSEPAGPVLLDSMALYIRWMSLAVAGLLVLLASGSGVPYRAEYLGTVLLAGGGLMALSVADNLILLFLALELVSIPTYILLGLGRRDAEGYEAAAKYFFLSLVASALVLYGISFLYGASGTLKLPGIRETLTGPSSLAEAELFSLALVGVVFLLAGLGFKIAAVPFHFYAPDVYQGTTYPNVAFLSAAPKIAGFTAMIRILIEGISPLDGSALIWRVVLALAILTMTVGNVVALWQRHLRRLLAYSSIGQAGYILAALAVGLGAASSEVQMDGLAAVLLYLVVYVVATIGAFSILEVLRGNGRGMETLEELGGLARHRPWAAAGLAVFMFSLAGVPPLAGFWGKWAVVLGAIKAALCPLATGLQAVWFILLAVLTMLNAAVAAGYYLRVVGIMYFSTSSQRPSLGQAGGPWLAGLLCAVLCVGVGLVPWPIWNASGRAAGPVVSQWGPAFGQPEGEAYLRGESWWGTFGRQQPVESIWFASRDPAGSDFFPSERE